MKVGIPKNIFSAMFSMTLEKELQKQIEVFDSALLKTKLDSNEIDVAFLPTLELVKDKELFVSSNLGMAFDSEISNSFLYFNKSNDNIDKILLRGDVSINEVLLCKVIFSELYNSDIEIVIDTKKPDFLNMNYLIIGNSNFIDNTMSNGVSFSSQVSDTINLPYVNFILVSKNREKLVEFESSVGNVDEKIRNQSNTLVEKLGLNKEVSDYLLTNLDSLYFNLSELETESIKEQLNLVYCKGIIEELFDIKFTKKIKE